MKVSKGDKATECSPTSRFIDEVLSQMYPRYATFLAVQRCRAHCKSTGRPCRGRSLANGRCKYHGGLSTGPKTEEGRLRALANLRQNRR